MAVRLPVSLAAILLLEALVAGSARAEIVFFSTGRHLSVRQVRTEGDRMVLTLRGGGEITCERSLITAIKPDEVEYPDEPTASLAPAEKAPSTGRYDDLIASVSQAHGVNARLVHAVVAVESAYRPDARSPKGAMGLMQLMPATARQYAVGDPYDPHSNLDAGTRHLKALLSRFSLPHALAAYNAGEAAVRRFKGVPPYDETREYVRRVLSRLGS